MGVTTPNQGKTDPSQHEVKLQLCLKERKNRKRKKKYSQLNFFQVK